MYQNERLADTDSVTKAFMRVLGALPVSLITKLQYQENYEFLTDEEKTKVTRAVARFNSDDDES